MRALQKWSVRMPKEMKTIKQKGNKNYDSNKEQEMQA